MNSRYLNTGSVNEQVLSWLLIDSFNIPSRRYLANIIPVSLRVFTQHSLEEAVFLLCCLCSPGYDAFLIYDWVSKPHRKMNNNDSKSCTTFFYTATFVLL